MCVLMYTCACMFCLFNYHRPTLLEFDVCVCVFMYACACVVSGLFNYHRPTLSEFDVFVCV